MNHGSGREVMSVSATGNRPEEARQGRRAAADTEVTEEAEA